MTRVPERVFVYYPRGVRTGGPEALHQLVSTLRAIGIEAYLTPIPGTEGAPRVADYLHYDAPQVRRVEDTSEVAVVTPEVYPLGIRGLRNAQRFCWWLSIDNAPAFDWRRNEAKPLEPRQIYRRIRGMRRAQELRGETINHLAQSHYAWAFLYSRLGVVSSMLSDFTEVERSDFPRDRTLVGRGSTVVAYNPLKGGEHIVRLRDADEGTLEWLPISGMTPSEVRLALSSSDVYLDLGHHPGKDRIPREAALTGALTLVARRGAGAYSADVPIPLEHKISTDGDIVANALAVLRRVLTRLPEEVARQDFYRSVIRAERGAFTRQVRRVFQDGFLGLDLEIPGLSLPDTE